jgi:hypothetical protein
VGCLAAVVAIVVATGRLLGDDQGTTSADGREPVGDRPSSSTSVSTTEPATTTAVPAQTATDAAGAFSVVLPPGWGSITVDGDMTGRGTEMFPDDSSDATIAENAFGALVTPQTTFLAIDGEASSLVPLPDILTIDRGPSAVGTEEAFAAAKQFHTGDPIEGEGSLATPAGEARWFEFSAAGIDARRYVLVNNGTGWVITYWTANTTSGVVASDQVVGSFTPT